MTSRAASFTYPTARLEAVRGMAAMVVAVFHSLLVVEKSSTQHGVTQAIFLFNGRAAVTLFFVLSGFVLGLSLRRASGSFAAIYFRFAVRRLFRIYPTVVVSTVVAVLILMLCRTFPPNVSVYMTDSFVSHSIAPLSIVRQLLLVEFINPVTWTLRMEIICSLLLPLAFWLEVKRPAGLWVALGFFVTLALISRSVISLAVLPAFLVGYVLPLTSAWWSVVVAGRWQGAVLFVLGVVILLLPRSLYWPLADCYLVETIGSALIVGSVVFGAHLHLFSFFDWHPIKVAGRVSYSFYVYHFPILALTSFIILPRIPAAFVIAQPLPTAFLLWAVSTMVAFPVAMLSYAAVEKPFIKLGTALVTREQSGKE
jgi:peptidoglycan/LPS O-acetylase OafA/YrhL